VLYHLHMTSYTMSLVVRWKTPKRVGLVVLFKSRTGSAELVKVRKTLCRVGDMFAIPNGLLLDVENFLCAVYPSISEINEVRFLLFCK
jgi:hypothetical protein